MTARRRDESLLLLLPLAARDSLSAAAAMWGPLHAMRPPRDLFDSFLFACLEIRPRPSCVRIDGTCALCLRNLCSTWLLRVWMM